MNDSSFGRRLILVCLFIGAGITLIASQEKEPPLPGQPQPAVIHVAPTSPQPVQPVQPAGAPAQRWMGYQPQPQKTEQFLKTLPKPTLRQANPELLRRSTDDQPVLLYRALYQAYAWRYNGAKWQSGAQEIGDCVSWGWAEGYDVHSAVLFVRGEQSDWRPAATEAIYGGSRVEARGVSQGGWGDGSYGGAAAKWFVEYGMIFRQPYPELGIDLTTYSGARAKQWGNYGCGGQGDNGRLDSIAKQKPVRNVALVTTFEEAAAAIESGYPVPVCSGYGFTSRRDGDGFAAQSGSWSHCMCFIGVRRGARPGLLCQNSWGTSWIGGPKWPDDQPDGSFWVDARVVEGMLSGRDSFAVSGFAGFPFRDLKHGDWVEVRPERVREIARKWNVPLAEDVYVLAP